MQNTAKKLPKKVQFQGEENVIHFDAWKHFNKERVKALLIRHREKFKDLPNGEVICFPKK